MNKRLIYVLASKRSLNTTYGPKKKHVTHQLLPLMGNIEVNYTQLGRNMVPPPISM